MKKSRDVRKLIGVLLAVTLLLGVAGFTYAYFGLEIEGKPKDIVMETGDLKLTYIDDTELKLTDAMPGDTVTKKIKVYNGGNKKVSYNFYWGDLVNTIDFFELHVIMECKSYKNYGTDTQEESGTCDRIYRAVPISDTVTDGNIKKNISIDAGITHEYTVTVQFDNKTYPQDDNLNKSFTGKIGIEPYEEPKEIYCTYDGNLTSNTSFEKGVYTYKYLSNYQNWNVSLTDETSTTAVTEAPCTYINNKPITSLSSMFSGTSTSSIDVSNFNTKYITDMSYMFYNCIATEIIGLENFDTSKVATMRYMFARRYDFQGDGVKTIGLSNFDTNNVTDMIGMFNHSVITSLDLSSFDTSKITSTENMFGDTKARIIDITSFDTGNVTNMDRMFINSDAIKLDVSHLNTSKVTNMTRLFRENKSEYLDLSGFDTSKVTDMYEMFANSKAIVLDVSSFNTSKVTDMERMFQSSVVTEIKGLENFDTSNVTTMNDMFYNTSNLKMLNLSSFDTSKVTNMNSMFQYCSATSLDLTSFNTSNVIDMGSMFDGAKMLNLNLSNFDTSKVTDMSYMFLWL